MNKLRKVSSPRKPVSVYTDKQLKAIFVLQAFTPSELQAHTSLKVLRKVGRKPHSPVIVQEELVAGAGIPASTIKRFQDGTYKRMGPVTLKKLSDFYNRYQQINLRSVGANKEDAKRFCKQPPTELRKRLNNYYYYAKQIQKNYKDQGIEKDLRYIQWGMAHSHHKYSEWEKLAALSGLSKYKPPRRRRKKGYGSHRE